MFTWPEEISFKSSRLVSHLQKKIRALELKLFKASLTRFLKSAGTVADIASGNGILLPLLQERQLTVYAVNSSLSPEEQKKWVKPGNSLVTFQTMDPKKLLFPDHAFDYVTSRGLFELLNENDRKRVLNELIRITRNLLFIAVRTTDFSLTSVISSLAAPELLPPSLMSTNELRAMINNAANLQLLELRTAGGLDRGFVIAVLQKKN